MALMNTAPVVICLANSTPRSTSAVHTLSERPNGVALASLTAAASLSATAIAATGPNVSSSKTGTPGPVPASTVGS